MNDYDVQIIDDIGFMFGRYPTLSESGGTKFDNDKLAFTLVPVGPLSEVTDVLMFGAEKYGANNWRQGLKQTRLLDAALRHIYQYSMGEDDDDESGLSHLAHAICELMFALEQQQVGTGIDDRYRYPDETLGFKGCSEDVCGC